MKIQQINKVSELDSYIKKCKRNDQNWFSNLALSLYGRELSALHKQNSPLVKKINNMMDKLNLTVGRAVII